MPWYKLTPRYLSRLLIILVLLVGCTPATRIITKKCPVPVSAVLNDTGLALGVLALSALKWETDHKLESVGYTMLGVSILTGAFVTEVTCL